MPDYDEQLTPHFKLSETRCRCRFKQPGWDGKQRCPWPPQQEQIDILRLHCWLALEPLRGHFGTAVKIVSGMRCPEYNKFVGGVKNSQHLYWPKDRAWCRATDVKIKGKAPSSVAKAALWLRVKGIGLYRSFCHLDSRTSQHRARWAGQGVPRDWA